MTRPPKVRYRVRTYDGRDYVGMLGPDIRRIVDAGRGPVLRRGLEVRTPAGAWITLWEGMDYAEEGGLVEVDETALRHSEAIRRELSADREENA